MACFPPPPVGTPPRRFVVAASSAINDQEPSGLRPRRALCIATSSADGYAEVSCVPAAGGRDKRPMDCARPRQERISSRGKSGSRTPGQRHHPETAPLTLSSRTLTTGAPQAPHTDTPTIVGNKRRQ